MEKTGLVRGVELRANKHSDLYLTTHQHEFGENRIPKEQLLPSYPIATLPSRLAPLSAQKVQPGLYLGHMISFSLQP